MSSTSLAKDATLLSELERGRLVRLSAQREYTERSIGND